MGPGIFTFFRACFNFVSKRFVTTETFGPSQFLLCFSPFQFFPYIIHCFSVSKHQKWGLVFLPFPELVSILFRNVSKQLKHLDLVNFLPVSVLFRNVSVTETLVNFCHVSVSFKNVSKHQKWGLFQFVSKQLKCSAIFIIFSVFQSFETIEPFGLVLDLVILQKFIFLCSLCVSMFQCFTETKCMPWVFAGFLCNI